MQVVCMLEDSVIVHAGSQIDVPLDKVNEALTYLDCMLYLLATQAKN